MINQFISTIKSKRGWNKERSGPIIDRDLLLFALLGIANVGIEYAIHRFISPPIKDVFIQISHLLIFFAYPAFIFIGSFKKSALFILVVFLTTIPLYLFILQDSQKFYLSALFMLNWLVYSVFFADSKKRLRLKKLLSAKGTETLIGLLCAILFAAHIVLVFYLAGNVSQIQPDWRWVWINFFLESSFSLVGMEFFFYYFLFLRLMEKNGFPFGLAYIVSTILIGLPFFTNPTFNSSIPMLMGMVYYIIMQGLIACALVKYTKSIAPAFVFGLIISVLISIVLGK